ncbi:MAG: diguanylate cyclase [Proteobacteria bacterium]|nr:diguanylate cyclase [Pseudomonadota bacterium]
MHYITVEQVMGTAVFGYMLLCVVIGFWNAANIRDLRSFALGYDKINTALLVATIYATHLGAGSTLGLIEQVNNIGIVAAVITLFGVCRWYITKLVFCNNVGRFATDCLSQADVMEKLYGNYGRSASNMVNVISSIGFVAIQVIVVGYVMQYFFGVSHAVGTLCGAIMVTLYSASGGIKAVILTDLMQAILFLAVVSIIFVVAAQKMSYQPDFWQTLPEGKTWIMPYDIKTTLTVLGMIICAFNPIGAGAPFIQRILISGSDAQLRKAFHYTGLLDLFVVVTISGIAILLMPMTGDGILTKVGLFEIIKQNLHPLLIMAIVMGVLSVTMSTADSWLNSGAVVITQLLARKYMITKQVLVARCVTILLGSMSAFAALCGDSVLPVLLISLCFTEPLILVQLILGFLGYKFTEKDYKRSVWVGTAAVFFGAYIEGEFGFIALLFGLIGSTIGLTWRKSWSFYKDDGTPLMQLPEYKKLSPGFFGLVLALGSITTFIHLHLSSIWLAPELSIVISFLACMLVLVLHIYGGTESMTYRISSGLAVMCLISSIASIALRTANPLLYTITIGTTALSLRYRQHWSVLFALVATAVAYTNLFIAIEVFQVPLIGTIIASGVVVLVTSVALYLQKQEKLVEATCKLAQTHDVLVETKSELNQAQGKLAFEQENARIDALTGVYNRRHLDETLAAMLAAASARNEIFSIAILDIDHFKQINDSNNGHLVGDACLKEFVRRVALGVRPLDIICRMGGDEFMVLMPRVDIAQGLDIAERVRTEVADAAFEIDANIGTAQQCTTSIGVTEYFHGDTVESIVQRADKALYEAKSEKGGTSRNRVCALQGTPEIKDDRVEAGAMATSDTLQAAGECG